MFQARPLVQNCYEFDDSQTDASHALQRKEVFFGVISRRTFLKNAAICTALIAAPRLAFSSPRDRSLHLFNIHTEEEIDICYCTDGSYDYEALERINNLLRCHYNNEVKPIDPAVLDLLSDIREQMTPGSRIEIISGYRSPEYNEYLRSIGRHVAGKSYHLQGLAIDFSIPGLKTRSISRVAKEYSAGGVGTYPEFVHIDVGPVRFW